MKQANYDDVGTGLAIVLIHGHPFDRSMWNPQLEILRSKYRIIAPDLRGYGQNLIASDITPFSAFAEDILDLLNRLGIAECVLCGLSMGGQIALECHRQFGNRITGMVLADTFAQLDTPERKQERFDTADRLLKEGMDGYSAEVLPKMISPVHIRTMPATAAHVLRMMKGTSAAGAAAALRGRAERRDYTPLLSTIRVPTLIVVGEQDEFTPISDARFMGDRIAGSEVVVIADSGHMPNLEQPEAFNAALLKFLEGLSGR
jgi:pimeloyl-ACP methyl ester carboxylesterase